MAKLYFNGKEVVQNQVLNEELLNLVEQGMARLEKQGTFRSLYDIEIMGVAVYYRKNWRYENVPQKEKQRAVEVAGVRS